MSVVMRRGGATRRAPSRKYSASGDRKPRDERWAQILEVAAEVFAEKGYDGCSLQEIASRTGILKGSIYYYIRSKEDLLADLVREAHDRGLAQIRPIAEGGGNPIERLAGMIAAHIRYVCTDRNRTAVFLHERKRLTPKQIKEYLGDEHAYRRQFEGVVVEGQAAGLIESSANPKLMAMCLLASLNSLYEWYRPQGDYSIREIADHFVRTSLVGVTTAKGAAALSKRRSTERRKRSRAEVAARSR